MPAKALKIAPPGTPPAHAVPAQLKREIINGTMPGQLRAILEVRPRHRPATRRRRLRWQGHHHL